MLEYKQKRRQWEDPVSAGVYKCVCVCVSPFDGSFCFTTFLGGGGGSLSVVTRAFSSFEPSVSTIFYVFLSFQY